MAVIYGEQYVDEKYSSAIEPNLYTDTVLIPGVTYTDKWQEGPGGSIVVHKLTTDAVAVGTPGRDFTDEAADDDLLPIVLNNNFQKSRKIYGVQSASVAFNAGEEYLADALAAVREGRQYSALASMVYSGTTYGDTTALTTENIVGYLTGMREAVKKNHGSANFCLASTGAYAKLLQVVGIQTSADESVRSGELLRRFGMNIIECDSFDKASVKFYDNSGTERTVNLKQVDLIVGASEQFAVVDNFNMYRLVDSENFAGTKAQVEINSGFRVMNAGCIQVKKNNVSA